MILPPHIVAAETAQFEALQDFYAMRTREQGERLQQEANRVLRDTLARDQAFVMQKHRERLEGGY